MCTLSERTNACANNTNEQWILQIISLWEHQFSHIRSLSFHPHIHMFDVQDCLAMEVEWAEKGLFKVKGWDLVLSQKKVLQILEDVAKESSRNDREPLCLATAICSENFSSQDHWARLERKDISFSADAIRDLAQCTISKSLRGDGGRVIIDRGNIVKDGSGDCLMKFN